MKKFIITEKQLEQLKVNEGHYVDFNFDIDDLSLEVWDNGKWLELESIVIPKTLRKQGIGTKIMDELIDYANKENKAIYLTPDTSFGGTSFKRLVDFYKRFGFIRNKDIELNKHYLVKYPNNNLNEDYYYHEDPYLKDADIYPYEASQAEKETFMKDKLGHKPYVAPKPEPTPPPKKHTGNAYITRLSSEIARGPVGLMKYKWNELTNNNPTWQHAYKFHYELTPEYKKWLKQNTTVKEQHNTTVKTQNKLVEEQHNKLVEDINTNNSGINFVFEQHPELANIGTQEQYSQYLGTIFPDSKVKDVVWRNDESEKNVLDTKSPNKAGQYRGRFFGTYEEVQYHNGQTRVMFPVLLNITKPYNTDSSKKLDYFYTGDINKIKQDGDGIISVKYDTKQPYEYVVFEPEQIHILGSKQDIEGFKKFMNINENKLIEAHHNKLIEARVNEYNNFILNLIESNGGILAYHGSDSDIKTFVTDFISGEKACDTNGPGIYFTSNKEEEAELYGKNIYTVKLHPRNLVSDKNKTSFTRVQAVKLIKLRKDWQMLTQDWHENPITGLNIYLNEIFKEENSFETLMNIFSDYYRYDSKEYVKNCTNIGIDGVQVTNKWGDGGSSQNYVVYNPNIIEIINIEKPET